MAKLTKQDADEIINVFSNLTPIKTDSYRGDITIEFELVDGREATYSCSGDRSLIIQRKKGYCHKERIDFKDFSLWQQIRLNSLFENIIKADRARRTAKAKALREASSARGIKLLNGPDNAI